MKRRVRGVSERLVRGARERMGGGRELLWCAMEWKGERAVECRFENAGSIQGAWGGGQILKGDREGREGSCGWGDGLPTPSQREQGIESG